MRVCYFGTYRQEYSRNQIMIEGLRRSGVEVVECHESLWQGVEDRVQAASGGWLRPAFLVRMLRAYFNLLRRYRHAGPYDLMVVGYPGQLDVFLARLLTRLQGKPLVWDIFMSIYLIALERGLDQRSNFTIGLLRQLERWSCRLPDRLILDTSEYVAWFGRVHGVARDRFRLVPTGADDRVFQPLSMSGRHGGSFRVLYYGTFIPNHGIAYIIEAARLLADDPAIQFELVGDGPERARAQTLASEYRLQNITFVNWLDKPELIQRIHQADICLGAFGATPQSLMTVQNKIYEGLAMAKTVISGDSAAVRQALQHMEHIYLCDRQKPQTLAEAVRILKNDPALCRSIAKKGHQLFLDKFTVQGLGAQFKNSLMDLIRSQ